MLDAVVILRNKYYAKTLATVRFDRHGKLNKLPQVVYADTWEEGFDFCWKEGLVKVLFVESGLVFEDFMTFVGTIDFKSPLIGGKDLFFLNTDLYTKKDLGDLAQATRNKTLEPLQWSGFQQGQITRLADPQKEFDWHNKQLNYVERITNHLWITNNEIIYPINATKYIGPASGACWWLNLCRPEIQSATLIDISYRQLDFARWLVDTWDGVDFGRFIVHYMYRNHVMSFTVDHDEVDVVKLLKSGTMADYVNNWVDKSARQFGIDDIATAWKTARTKPIKMLNEDLVPWVLKSNDIEGLWCSNVSNFKYTLMHNSWEDIEAFNAKVAHGQKIN